MKGLAKVAWTIKQISNANTKADELVRSLASKERMEQDEIEAMLDYVRNQNINLDSHVFKDTDPTLPAFYQPAKEVLKAKEELSKNPPSNLDPIELKQLNFDDNSDGLLFSPNVRNYLAHELGHAIDESRNGKLVDRATNARRWVEAVPQLTGTVSTGASIMGTSFNDEDHNSLVGALTGGAVGGGAGLLASHSLNNSILKEEERANAYADEIIRGIHDEETAEKLIRRGNRLNVPSLDSYRLDGLRNLKNTGLHALGGAGVGLGLGYLFDKRIAPSLNKGINEQTAEN